LGSFFLTVPFIRLAGLVYALAVMGALTYLLKKTTSVLAVRAVAQNKEAAGLMGVDIKRTSAAVYGLYVGISAMTGVFVGAIVVTECRHGARPVPGSPSSWSC